jgi:hypothetical protein
MIHKSALHHPVIQYDPVIQWIWVKKNDDERKPLLQYLSTEKWIVISREREQRFGCTSLSKKVQGIKSSFRHVRDQLFCSKHLKAYSVVEVASGLPFLDMSLGNCTSLHVHIFYLWPNPPTSGRLSSQIFHLWLGKDDLQVGPCLSMIPNPFRNPTRQWNYLCKNYLAIASLKHISYKSMFRT